MATQKPISTISYNSEAFLKEKLEAWLDAHIISAYQYICHKGEDGDKDHIHVRIEPNKRLDAMDLQEALREYVQGSEKPLGCRPFRPSKEEDWFLYAVHDSDYLKTKYKGGDRGEKLPYKWQDIKAPFDYDVEIAFIRAKSSLDHTSSNIAQRLMNGESPLALSLEGENPFVVKTVFQMLSSNDYQRLQEDFYALQAECDDVKSRYGVLSRKFEELIDAIDSAGISIEADSNGKIVLRL